MSMVELKNISFHFSTQRKSFANFLSYIFKKKSVSINYQVVENVTLSIHKGDAVALIGRNGAGKSTLLKLIAGIYLPDKGNIEVHGKISPLLNLSCGFRPELSGIDNIYLSSFLLGLTKKQINTKIKDIVSFSELEDFIHLPVKTYSTGMKARLGFSIAVQVNPDILIIDEILSVGDIHFNKKAQDKMESLIQQSSAIIMCTHNLNWAKKFCNKAVWLDKGRIRQQGNCQEVVNAFIEQG